MIGWMGRWLGGSQASPADDGKTAATTEATTTPSAASAAAPDAPMPVAPPPPAGGFDCRGLLGKALEERALFDAWERVRDNQGAAGSDGQTVQVFASNVLGRLQQLRSEVMKGTYAPQPLLAVSIPKADGRMRQLAIPSVRDRILQTALAQVLKTILEPEFEESSYGYRPGRSVAQAVARVARFRDQGARHVVDADIESFFDNIHHPTLLKQLRAIVPDPGVLSMVSLWLNGILREGHQQRLITRGVPQGSPISPLLSNLYLDDLDEAVLARYAGLVRYADDFVILTHTREQAAAALELVRGALKDLRLKLNEQKTRLTHFEQGFTFLGVRFHGPLMEADPQAEPWLLPDRQDATTAARHEARQAVVAASRGDAAAHRDSTADVPRRAEATEAAPHRITEASADPSADGVAPDVDLSSTWGDPSTLVQLASAGSPAPLLQGLYVAEHGTWLAKDGERVVVRRSQESLASVPLGQLDHIAIHANAMVSTALLRYCARQRIAVVLSDGLGDDFASLDRGGLPDLELLSLQQRRHRHDAFNLMLARGYVEGKLHNSKLLLRRFSRRQGREQIEPLIERIDTALHRLAGTEDCAQVRGLEGVGAKAYFDGMKLLLPGGFGFGGRKRRPPADPVNAMLSFGYAVLHGNVHALVRLAGLNVHFGALHVTGQGTHALVNDLMEEFRAPVVDSVVLTLLREGRLNAGDFEYDASAELPCKLRQPARRVFVEALENKLESRFLHPRLKRVMDLRRGIQEQVRHLVRVLQRDEPVYLPLKLK